MTDMQQKRFVSWNVNGLRAVEKKGFATIVASLSPHILALQEIKATPDQLSSELINLPGYTSYWASAQRKGYAGVAIYARQEPLAVLPGIGIDEHDREGRILGLEYEDYYFLNIYFPNAQPELARLDYKLRFNSDVMAFANRLAASKSVVICGDFNVAHKPIDLANPKANENNPGYSAPERAWLDTFINDGYIDTFRKFNQKSGQYSWWSYRFNARAKNIGWRIDYFCVDVRSEGRVMDATIRQDIPGSDHAPVLMDFC